MPSNLWFYVKFSKYELLFNDFRRSVESLGDQVLEVEVAVAQDSGFGIWPSTLAAEDIRFGVQEAVAAVRWSAYRLRQQENTLKATENILSLPPIPGWSASSELFMSCSLPFHVGGTSVKLESASWPPVLKKSSLSMPETATISETVFNTFHSSSVEWRAMSVKVSITRQRIDL